MRLGQAIDPKLYQQEWQNFVGWTEQAKLQERGRRIGLDFDMWLYRTCLEVPNSQKVLINTSGAVTILKSNLSDVRLLLLIVDEFITCYSLDAHQLTWRVNSSKLCPLLIVVDNFFSVLILFLRSCFVRYKWCMSIFVPWQLLVMNHYLLYIYKSTFLVPHLCSCV